MGTEFFKGKAPAINGGGNPGLEARSIGSAISAGRGAQIGAQKTLGKAEAINKAGAFKPLKRSAAYPAGPKL
jgi:hypothetical protein